MVALSSLVQDLDYVNGDPNNLFKSSGSFSSLSWLSFPLLCPFPNLCSCHFPLSVILLTYPSILHFLFHIFPYQFFPFISVVLLMHHPLLFLSKVFAISLFQSSFSVILQSSISLLYHPYHFPLPCIFLIYPSFLTINAFHSVNRMQCKCERGGRRQ